MKLYYLRLAISKFSRFCNRYRQDTSTKALFRRFGNKYRQGTGTKAILSKIIISKEASGSITLGNNVLCNAELYCFLNKGNISIGDFSYVGDGSRIWALDSVTIGNRVLISHNVFIVDNQTHPINAETRHQQFKAKFDFPFPNNMDLGEKPIVIEDDVWIAANVIILRGVHIGKGAIVGAGAVVTKNVPAGKLVAGNPASIIGDAMNKHT
jgi:acetyltransferase-like isoleucine patch superfamily enzyme